ncbi:MAG TPA: MFS transporter [Bryobacteraceae bacterium]|nr:MFS transporter [Bryobacteraceae bacterium]
MKPTTAADRYRWWILTIFVLSSAINYLDRQSLATLAPLIRADFQLSREQYGWILGVFSITYASSAPFAGAIIDGIGLNRGISLAVGLWSAAGIATGFTRGLSGLMGCRAVLGIAEAGGVPAVGKAVHTYLRPPERAMGNAMNQAGISLGMILAPPLATWIAVRYGWRMAFVLTGVLGLLWIPVWNWMARHSAPAAKPGLALRHSELLRDRRLWGFVAANGLSMVGYSLWSNWTTQYLVDSHGLTVAQAAWYAWIPPLVAMGGGFAGGWFSLRLMDRGMAAADSRFRVCLAAAVLSLVTAAIPLAPTAAWSTAGISMSIFAVSAFAVNTYTLPLDVFGGERAAFAVSMLVASYGAIQLAISPWFGHIIDRHGYGPVTAIAAVTPMAACVALRAARSSG